MRSIFLAFLLILALCKTVQAQTRSLHYYLSHAINNNPKIATQLNRADSARLQKKIIHAKFGLPLISAKANYLYAPIAAHYGYAAAVSNGGLYDALLNINYPLFTGKNKNVRNRAASIAIRKANYRITHIKHTLRDTITSKYITAYDDLKRLQFLKDILKLLKRQNQVIKKLARQGVTRIIDVKQLNIQLQSNRIAQKKARKTYQHHVTQLNIKSGVTTPFIPVNLETPTISIDTATIVQHSRFMKQFTLDSLKTAAQQRIFELKYHPKIAAFGNTGLKTNKFLGIQNNFGYSVGFNISVPIYDGNQRKITRRQTQLQQNSIDVLQRRFKKKRYLHLSGLRKQLEQTNQQLALLRKEITQYKSLLKDYRKELANGLVKTVNYLVVLRQYTKARQQQVLARGNLLKIKNEYNYWNW
jgi:outer membrane protein TolC